MQNLIAAISFGTSARVNEFILRIALLRSGEWNMPLWADPYFRKLNLLPADSDINILDSPLPNDGRYISNVRVFLSLARFAKENNVSRIRIICAPQILERVNLDKRMLPKSTAVEIMGFNIPKQNCYGQDSEHPQTRSAEAWEKYEKRTLKVARLCWPLYAKVAGLSFSELAEVKFGFGK